MSILVTVKWKGIPTDLSIFAVIIKIRGKKMPEQIENRMIVDSEWEGVEFLQMRTPDRVSKRMKKIIDELEQERMETENE